MKTKTEKQKEKFGLQIDNFLEYIMDKQAKNENRRRIKQGAE